ncbi:hypothetical protein HYX70_02170 [Candidatus Saccharibacteria bacterium]|nr:hypothetical protein [Candidatus Saccharibacteria bacterium]
MQNDHDNTFPLPNSGGADAQQAVPGNDWQNQQPAAPQPAIDNSAAAQPAPAAPEVNTQQPADVPAPGQVIADLEAHQLASADYSGGVAPNPAAPQPLGVPAETAQQPAPQAPAANTLDLSNQQQAAPSLSPEQPAVPPAAEPPAATNQYGITPAQPVLAQVPGGTEPVTAAAMPPGAEVAPSGLPTDLNDAMLDPNLMAATAPKPKFSPLKLVLIIAGVVIGLFVLLSLIVYITGRTARKPAIELNDATSTGSQSSSSSNEAVMPAGFVKIDKDCYSFGAYQTNTIPSGGACNFSATEGGYKVAVNPITDSYDNLDVFTNSVKSSLSSPSVSSLMLDGMNASKIVYSQNGNNQVKYLVLVNGKNYKFNDKAVTGFTIDMDYTTPNAQNNANNLVNTWRWK